MAWFTTRDPEEFLAAAGEFLRSKPAEHTVALTVAEDLRRRGPAACGDDPPLLGWWQTPVGIVASAFTRTPPHPAVLTHVPPQAVPPLAEALATVDPPLSGIHARPQIAEAFAAEWLRRTGCPHRVHRRHRLYRLGELQPPTPAPPGKARTAGPADRDLLVAWHEAFGRETGESGSRFPRVIDDRIGYGGLTLWEVDGVPVSMAGRTRVVAGMVRVAPVYTPADLRGRGYAGAVTAEVSRSARDAGADEVLLFTDLANPTSNALYQRLGYLPVADTVVLSLVAGPRT